MAVERRALFERLSAAVTRGVVVLSASAGSGKTTLLRSWIEESGLRDRTAWVSLERGERDSQRFWLVLIDALRGAAGEPALLAHLSPAPGFDGRALIERLLHGLNALREPVVLVLDDLHELSAPEALEQLETFLSRRPARLNVVLSSRHDPQIRLHRLRISGELTEIRDADMRFTFEETRRLVAAFGVNLAPASISTLYAKTEGWIAGLRLALLSLASRPDPDQFVTDFSGSERTIAEYLFAEVLEREPDDVRELLLQTSVLEQVNGELADALLMRSGSERILQKLEAENAFVSSIDASRSCFRYHHLFADLLRLELRRKYPDAVFQLHRAAAEWYAANGKTIEAARHAKSAGDWKWAARLLGESYFSLALNGQDATVAALLETFPAGARSDPEWALLFGLTQLGLGSPEEVEAYVALAERRASQVSEERRGPFDGALAVARLTLARIRGDFTTVVDEVGPLLSFSNGRRTLNEIALSHDLRALALMNLGIAEKWGMRFPEGEAHLLEGLELARRSGRAYAQIGCLSYLGLDLRNPTGSNGQKQCTEALAMAEAQGWGSEPIATPACVRLLGYAVEAGRFNEAAPLLERIERTLRVDADPAIALLFNFTRATYHLLHNDLPPARAAVAEARRLKGKLPLAHDFAAMATEHLVQLQLRVTDLDGARATLDTFAQDHRQRAEYRIAAASLELAGGDPRAAADLLEPVVAGSARNTTAFTTVTALLLDAQAQNALGFEQETRGDLERVLQMAEDEAVISAFAVAPPGLRRVLEQHMQRGTSHRPLLRHILDVLGGAFVPAATVGQPRGAELTESELRVLRYLPTNLTAPEIGTELNVSLNTIKTHIREIYAKLCVHTRSEAVESARKYGLTRIPRA